MKILARGGAVSAFFCLVCAAAGCGETQARPEPPALSAGSCPAMDAMRPASESDYGRKVQQEYLPYLAEQHEALGSGEGGQVVLCVRLNERGYVSDARVEQSSGYPLLDGAALYALGSMDFRANLGFLPRSLAYSDGTAWFAVKADFPSPSIAAGSPHPCADGAVAACPAQASTGFHICPALSPPLAQQLRDRVDAAFGRDMHYPPGAQRERIEGKVGLCLSVDRNGAIQDATLAAASGSPWLDGEALMSAGRIQLESGLIAGYGSMQLPDGGVIVYMPLNWKIRN